MTPQILILAAGSATRMRGGDKLLELVDGRAQLARIAAAALATGCPVTVALRKDHPGRMAVLQGLPVQTVLVPNPQDGMAASLIAGVAALPVDAAMLVVLGDMPELTAEDLGTCLAVWASDPAALLRGTTADGTAGHPVGFPPDLRDELLALSGDEGARAVLARHKHRLRQVPLEGAHAITDLDTPEDWARWRAVRLP